MGGANVFLQPNQLVEEVVEYLVTVKGWELKPRHVVVRSEHEQLVRSVIQSALEHTPRSKRSNTGCRVKNQTELEVPIHVDATPHAEDHLIEDAAPYEYIVKNTLVHVPIPSSMYSALSVHAATA